MPKNVDNTDRPQKSKTPEQALGALMRYCSRAERSGGDALRLMRNWGIADADAKAVLERLKEQKFIDDERFAFAFVRDKMRFSGWGTYKIRAGLKAKGISSETAEKALRQIDEGENDERLRSILERKLLTLKDETKYGKKAKLVRYALSRGFDYDKVLDIAEDVLVGTGDEK